MDIYPNSTKSSIIHCQKPKILPIMYEGVLFQECYI